MAPIVDGLLIPEDEPDLVAKRDALAAFVAEVLGRHDADFQIEGRVATEVDELLLLGPSAADQARAMGTPARYAEVLWRERGGDGDDLFSGAAATAAHTFLVTVFYGAGDGSDDAFAALLESRDKAAPGLLVALRALPVLPTGDGAGGASAYAEVGRPEQTVVTLTHARPRENGRSGYQHEAACLVTLT